MNKFRFILSGVLILSAICLIGATAPSFPQSKIPELEQKFSPSELRADFKILRENMEKLHIGLYSYTSKTDFDKTFGEIHTELNQPMTAMEFFRKITRLNKLIGNGHTSFSPPQTILDAIRKTLPNFPLETFWDGKSLYVLQNLSNQEGIKPGSKIRKINGTPTGSLMKEMADRIKRDGYNTTYPNMRLSRIFPIHYAVLTDIPDEFELELEEPSGETKSLKINGLTTDEIEKNRFTRYKEKKTAWENTKDPALALSINGGVAIMKVRTFQRELIKKKGQNWKKFFKQSFKRIRRDRVNHLIIDLRDNNGGQPTPTIGLLSNLVNKPFKFYKSINAKVGKIPQFPYFVKDGSIENFESIGWVRKGDLFELKDKKTFTLNKPVKKPFLGKIYVLTNAFSTSATSSFAGQLKSHTKAVFIGEETGGNPNQTVARQTVALILPKTRIKTIIPLVLSVKSVNFKNTGHGIIPDHEVKPDIRDILTGRDPVMEFTLELIKNGQTTGYQHSNLQRNNNRPSKIERGTLSGLK